MRERENHFLYLFKHWYVYQACSQKEKSMPVCVEFGESISIIIINTSIVQTEHACRKSESLSFTCKRKNDIFFYYGSYYL